MGGGFCFEGSPQFTGHLPAYNLLDAQINWKSQSGIPHLKWVLLICLIIYIMKHMESIIRKVIILCHFIRMEEK